MLLKQKRGKRERIWDGNRDWEGERDYPVASIFISLATPSISDRSAAGQMTYLHFLAVEKNRENYFVNRKL